MKRLLFFVTCLPFILTACGPQIYKSNQFSSVATTHKTVAILPAIVSIQLRPNEAKKVNPEDIRKNEESTGYSIQDQMYGWFLRENDKMKYTVAFQDVNKTNSILKKANISYQDLRSKSKQELASLLGVDAVISTTMRMEKPMSEGAAITVGILVGAWGATNKANITIDIHENKSGDLIWKYDYQASGSVFNSPEQLVKGLMRNASKKFPYNQKGR
jgi:hypothetical protein